MSGTQCRTLLRQPVGNMNNLFNLAKNGMSVAQYAMSVNGDNLTNGFSPTYSRREAIIGEAGGLNTGRGFFGYGAKVMGVQRAYDAFANTQLRNSLSSWAALDSRKEQLYDIDNMLGDESDNVSVTLNNLFKSMSAMSGELAEDSARNAMFNSLNSVAQRFNESGKRLSALEKSTNTQIEKSVTDINSMTDQLAEINKQLTLIQGNGTPPPNLLDQRDALLEKLSEQIGISVNENKVTGLVDVTLSDGRALVTGDKAYKLSTSPSPSDPGKTTVSYIGSDGNETPLKEESIVKGRLGGLFKFRNEDLILARNDLNEIAYRMAEGFNEKHHNGYTPGGNAGGDLFSLPAIKGIANSNNTGTANLTNIKAGSSIKADDYTLSYENGAWKATDSGGKSIPVAVTGTTLSFAGMTMDLPAGMNNGDKFVINPMAGAAEGMSRAITSPQDIAAAGAPGEESNNKNIEEMLKLQTAKLIGNSTLSEAYSSLVGTIGSNAGGVQSAIKSSEIDLEAKYNAKQSLSGVNMDEESVNNIMFLQYYNACSQILKTATSMFDSLLSINN